MNIMSKIEIYGFGSFFNGNGEYRDIDLLLVHEDRSKDSCMRAIRCKQELQSILKNLHITMLSKKAEESFSFKSISLAKFLGYVDIAAINLDVVKIADLIDAYSKNRAVAKT